MSKEKIEKDIVSIYLPLGLVEIIDKRAREYFFNRSKQIQFDLLNYYQQIGYMQNIKRDNNGSK